MRSILAIVLAAMPVPAPRVRIVGHVASCGGVAIAVPASLTIREVTIDRIVAASADAAFSVATDDDPPDLRRGDAYAFVIDLISDPDRPAYRYAGRRAHACMFSAMTMLPTTADGTALAEAVAGANPEWWMLGSPRALRETPLAALHRQLAGH